MKSPVVFPAMVAVFPLAGTSGPEERPPGVRQYITLAVRARRSSLFSARRLTARKPPDGSEKQGVL